MKNPCHWETDKLECFPDCITGNVWENCQFGKLSPKYEEAEKAKTRKAKMIMTAVINPMYDIFDHDPEIMNKIEGLNLEDIVLELLRGE